MNKDNVVSKMQMSLDDKYPELDRRQSGWKLVVFDEKATCRKTRLNTTGKVPIYYYLGWDLGKKYTGEKLRELRKLNGVGNVRHIKKT